MVTKNGKKKLATAIIEFYEGNHVEATIDDVTFVTPKSISVAERILFRDYMEKRGHMRSLKRRAEQDRLDEDERKSVSSAPQTPQEHAEEDVRLLKAKEDKFMQHDMSHSVPPAKALAAATKAAMKEAKRLAGGSPSTE